MPPLKNVLLVATALGGVQKLRLQNLAFFDHLPPSIYIFYCIKVYKKSIFLTTYPPPLVNIVCERPLSGNTISEMMPGDINILIGMLEE